MNLLVLGAEPCVQQTLSLRVHQVRGKALNFPLHLHVGAKKALDGLELFSFFARIDDRFQFRRELFNAHLVLRKLSLNFVECSLALLHDEFLCERKILVESPKHLCAEGRFRQGSRVHADRLLLDEPEPFIGYAAHHSHGGDHEDEAYKDFLADRPVHHEARPLLTPAEHAISLGGPRATLPVGCRPSAYWQISLSFRLREVLPTDHAAAGHHMPTWMIFDSRPVRLQTDKRRISRMRSATSQLRERWRPSTARKHGAPARQVPSPLLPATRR